MTKFKSIVNGWKNDLLYKLGILPPHLKQLFDARLAICNSNECGRLKLGICTACGCIVKKKTKSITEDCPENMWNPLVYEGLSGDIFILYKDVPPLIQPILKKFLISLDDWRGEEYIKKFAGQDLCTDGVYIMVKDWHEFRNELQ